VLAHYAFMFTIIKTLAFSSSAYANALSLLGYYTTAFSLHPGKRALSDRDGYCLSDRLGGPQGDV